MVWVSSRPVDNHAVRQNCKVSLGLESKASDWFRSSVAEHDLGVAPYDSIVGVAVLKPWAVYDHTLVMSALSRKCWRYWDRVCCAIDGVSHYVFEVVDVYEFDHPQPWTVVQTSCRCHAFCFHILEHKRYQRLVPYARADLMLREPEPVLAVRLPRTLAKLAVSGKVQSLVLPDCQTMSLGFNRALLGYCCDWEATDRFPNM